MNIAIIPARGGSKRIPRKNIRPLNGKPLIAWPIEACLKSGLFEHVLVSTDDDEIAAIATHYGAEAPFRRPAELADDFVATRPVTEHALGWARENWGNINNFCLLYANPFTTIENLARGYERLSQSDADEVLSVTEFAFPILRSFKINERGGVQYAFPEYKNSRSQDLPAFYHDAAQFYWNKEPYSPDRSDRLSLPLIIPRHLAVDIDTEEDWIFAEHLHALFILNAQKIPTP